MWPKWQKLADLAKKSCTLYTFNALVYSLLPIDNLFKNIFDLTTADDWDCDSGRTSPSLSL